MKKLYSKLWLAALPLAFVACQNEDMAVEQTTVNKTAHTLRCVMGNYAPQSRAQVETGNADVEQEQFMWNAGDAFTLYDHADIDATANVAEPAATTFTIADYKDEEPSASADFLGEGELEDGHRVTAVYPVQTGAVNKGIRQLVIPDFSAAPMGGNTEEDQKAYMASRMFMYADGTMGGEQTNLTFNHLCAMVRVSYTNVTDGPQSLKGLSLQGDAEYFGEKMDFNVLTHEVTVPFTSTGTALSFDNLTVEWGRTVDFYLLFFPGKEFTTNGTLELEMADAAGAKFKVSMPVSDISGSNGGATKFEAGKRYWLNVMQTKGGLIWKKSVGEGVISNRLLIQAVENQKGITFDKDDNGFVNVEANKEKIESVTHFWNPNLAGLSSLEGMEYFTNLEELYIGNMNLKKLDVSKNTKLKILHCGDNALTKLDVSANTQLEILNCGWNKLTKLDVSKNTALKELSCNENNNLAELDVTANAKLEILDCYYLSLAELDVTDNPELRELYCGGNQIASLDVSKNTKLERLNVLDYNGNASNLITSLDVSRNLDLKELNVDNCQLLTSLDVSKNTKLTRLVCGSTAITSLDVSKNLLLESLDCGATDITSLDISKNLLLKSLECNNAHKLTSLDVSHNVNLTELHCYWTAITTLDVSKNTALTRLYCSNREMTSLDVSKNTALTDLRIEAAITTLDVSKNTALTYLECCYCRLSALDITQNTKLEGIRVGSQRDENGENLQLTLTLLASQKTSIWDGQPEYDWGNERVTVNVVPD